MSSNVIEFLINLAESMRTSMQGVYEWLVTEFSFLGTTYSVYEMLFGGAFVLVLTYAISKFIYNIFG